MGQAKYEICRKCPICGAVFQIRTIDAVYCSKQCSDVAYKRKKDREAKTGFQKHEYNVIASLIDHASRNVDIRDLTDSIKTAYMMFAEINELNVKVSNLTEEIDGLKFRLTLIDEDTVQKLRNSRIAEKNRADKAERELGNLRSAHENLSMQWNALWKEPEFNEAAKKVKERKEREARLAAEAKREAEARITRHNCVLDKFISEGRAVLRAFALTTRTSFNQKEASSIYYGIMASASKHNHSLFNSGGIEASVKDFLSGLSWKDCSDFREECVCSWTKLFATKEVDFSESAISNFCAFVDHMSCSAETYVSLGGSNGCADQLTNWDGTLKTGLGSPAKKKGLSVS